MGKLLERLRKEIRGNSAYDAAGRRRNESWNPLDGKAENLNNMGRDTLRKRARDLERNADHVEAMLLALERNVVGNGIRLRTKINQNGSEQLSNLEKQIEVLWEEWCKPENCDITGRQCFSEMESMAVRRMEIDGGLFFLAVYTGDRRMPLQLQIREVDELYTAMQLCGGNKVVNGIELNQYGKAVAYHFIDYDWYGQTGKSTRVDADRVIYLNRITRPSQIREVSGLSNILSRLRDLNQYIDAISIKERILACLAVFIKKITPSGFGRPGKAEKDRDTGAIKDKLSPGMIRDLSVGEDISVVNPSGQASNAKDMISTLTRSAAAAEGLSYEAVSRDMSQVNYSSARQNLLEDRETYRQWQHYLSEHLCRKVYEWFLDSVVLAGTVQIRDYFQNRSQYIRHEWIAKGISWIDPVKEVNANRIALETGQITLEEIAAEQGKDWKERVRQRIEERKYIKDMEKEFQLTGGDQNGKQQPDGGKEDPGKPVQQDQ